MFENIQDSDVVRNVFGIVSDKLDIYLREDYSLRSNLKDEILRDLGISNPSIVINQMDELIFEDKRVDLSNQPLMKSLFETFLSHYRCRVGREELVRLIYDRDIDIASRRRLMCDYHNIVKLVSRARKLAKYKLDCPDNPRWDWFPYDATSEEWTLMRPRGVLH